MAETHDEFELCIDVDDCEVDFLDRHGDAGVDGDEASNVGVEVDIGFEILNVELDAPDGEVGDIEEDVGRGRGGCGGGRGDGRGTGRGYYNK